MREAAKLTGATLSVVISTLPGINDAEKAALLLAVDPPTAPTE
jgi:hypothetical protein